ncbi:uncharacterized protein F5891DRAFT_978210 [Suillus fuscotomentosus]|uniref:Uncharacterized protein n=1 Tax=Suillus fuscotomentosus TaxID=1912939 RepID=A0AAD4EE03_9AGAM|nr:uncharacterized protein F5891DRAFT_978210 [Suillus fuscotomentosus]KAG1903183.1 hypothetical protein F5891DRAFT_978210 [Suillus fuscotomentosus]
MFTIATIIPLPQGKQIHLQATDEPQKMQGPPHSHCLSALYYTDLQYARSSSNTKEFATTTEDVIMVTSSIAKDMQPNSKVIYWPNAIYTDSDWDGPDVGIDHSIPGPSASKGELLDALKALQIDIQKLCKENRALKEENKVLLAEKPKQSIADAHSSEIKKLQNVVGTISDLPSKYFTNIGYDHVGVPEIQKMLGVTSATNPTYTTFPLVLFPNLIEDKPLKIVFRNWKMLAQILKVALHGVTSLYQGTSHGGSTHTNSQKWDVHQVTPGSIAWASIMAQY